MNNIFNTDLNEKLNNRDLLQNDFDISFANSDFSALRNHYRKLRNIELDTPLNSPCETVCISSLAENITLACDVICADYGRCFIYCGNDTLPAKTNSRLITKVILNLLSNAFLYGNGELVTVKTIEKADFISIEVQNSGTLTSDFSYGKGLSFVKKVCEQYNGRFFMEVSLLSVKQIMLIPKSHNLKVSATIPDFCELLNDKLSPVYVEFFGIK